MSVAKTIEITASSKKGFEDAVKMGVAKAAESLAKETLIYSPNRVRI